MPYATLVIIFSLAISSTFEKECTTKQRKLEKLLVRNEVIAKQKEEDLEIEKHPMTPNKYLDFIDNSVDLNIVNSIRSDSCHSIKLPELPSELLKNCEAIGDNFKNKATLISSLHNGRLGK